MERKGGISVVGLVIAVILIAAAIITAAAVCALRVNDPTNSVSVLSTPIDSIPEFTEKDIVRASSDAPVLATAGSNVNQITSFSASPSSYSKYDDITVTVTQTKSGHVLAGVYAVYASDSNGGDLAGKTIALTKGSGENEWRLKGISGDCYLLGEWRASTYDITWTNDADWSISDKKDVAIVGVGVTLDDMPTATKDGYVFSHWQCTGNKIGGGTYDTTYIPADAISATCEPKSVTESSNAAGDGALTTNLLKTDNDNWAGYFDYYGVDSFTSAGAPNDSAIRERIASNGSLTCLFRGLGSACATSTADKINAKGYEFPGRGAYYDGRLNQQRVGVYMTKTIYLTNQQRYLLQNGYRLLIQASGDFTVGIKASGGSNTGYVMADMSLREGAGLNASESANRLWNADLAAYGSDVTRLCYPEGRQETGNASSQSSATTTKTMEIYNTSATSFQIQLEFTFFDRGNGSKMWIQMYGYVQNISYTVIPVKDRMNKTEKEVNLAGATGYAGAGSGSYQSNYSNTGKSGMGWFATDMSATDTSNTASIPIAFTDNEKTYIKNVINSGGLVYVTVTATFSVGQQRTSGSDKGYTYAKFSAWAGADTAGPTRLNMDYSPMSDGSTIRYPAAHYDWSGNTYFEWNTVTMTTKRIPLTATTAGVTPAWSYVFHQDSGQQFTHCLLVEKLSYSFIYYGSASHDSAETVYIPDRSYDEVSGTISVTSSDADNFNPSYDSRGTTLVDNNKYTTGWQSNDGWGKSLGHTGTGISLFFSDSWREWNGYNSTYFTISNSNQSNIIAAIKAGKTALVTVYSTYYVSVKSGGSGGAFGFTGGEFSGWIGTNNNYNTEYRTENGIITVSAYKRADFSNSNLPQHLYAGGTYSTKEIPVRVNDLSNNSFRVNVGWKWTFWNSGSYDSGSGCHHAGIITAISYKIRIVDEFTGNYANGYTYTMSKGENAPKDVAIGASGSTIYDSTKLWKANADTFEDMGSIWSSASYRCNAITKSTTGADTTYTAGWIKKKLPLLSKDVFIGEDGTQGEPMRKAWYYEYGESVVNETGTVPTTLEGSKLYVYDSPNGTAGFRYLGVESGEIYRVKWRMESPEFTFAEAEVVYGTQIALKNKVTLASISGFSYDYYWKKEGAEDYTQNNSGLTLTNVKESGKYTLKIVAKVNKTVSGGSAEIRKSAFMTATFTIKPRPVNVKVGTKTITYGDNEPNFSTFDWSVSADQPDGGGLTYGQIKGTSNIALSSYRRTVGADYAEGDSKEHIGTDDSGNPIRNAGTYDITATPNSTDPDSSVYNADLNYLVNVQFGSLIINKRTLSVTVQDATQVYGDPEATINYNLSSGEIQTLNGESAAAIFEVYRRSGRDSGDYYIYVYTKAAHRNNYIVEGVAATGNKTFTPYRDPENEDLFVTAIYTITPKPIGVTINVSSKQYGDPDNLTWGYDTQALVEGDVANEVINVNITRTPGEAIGSYTLSATATSQNYAVTLCNSGTATLTIHTRKVKVKLDDASKTYGEDDPTSWTWTLAEGSTAAFAGTANEEDIHEKVKLKNIGRADGKNVKDGGYAITGEVDLGKTSEDYDVEIINGVFTINPREVTVLIGGATKIYGQRDDEAITTATLVAGTMGYDEPFTAALSFTRIDPDNPSNTANLSESVGTYELYATSGANYLATIQRNENSKLVISKRPLYISIDKTAQKIYGEDDPATYSWVLGSAPNSNEVNGLVGEETTSVVTGITFKRTLGEAAGRSYFVTIETATADNYDIRVTDSDRGKLTINKRPIKYTIFITGLTFDSDKDKYYAYYGTTIGSKLSAPGYLGEVPSSKPAVLDGDTIDITVNFSSDVKAVKDYTVSYNVDAPSDYNVSVVLEVTQFSIVKKPINIYLLHATKIYGQNDNNAIVNDDGEEKYAIVWKLAEGSSTAYGEDAYQDSIIRVIGFTRVATGETVGDYAFTASTIVSAGYEINIIRRTPAQGEEDPKDGILTIMPKPITISVFNAEKYYGEDDPASFEWDIKASTPLAYQDGKSEIYFRAFREDTSNDVKDGGYVITGNDSGATSEYKNANYTITVEPGTLTISPLRVSFIVEQDATIVYGKALVSPEEAGAHVLAETSLPYEDKIIISYAYNKSDSEISALGAQSDPYTGYVTATVQFYHDNDESAAHNYLYDPIYVDLYVAEGVMYIDLTGIAASYNFVEGGINIDVSGIIVKDDNDASANIISGAKYTAKIISNVDSTVFFVGEREFTYGDSDNKIRMTYVPSVNKTTTFVNVQIVFNVSAEGFKNKAAYKTVKINKSNIDMSGLVFAFGAASKTYDGEPITAAYSGELHDCLTASVSYDRNNDNIDAGTVTATLAFDLIGHEGAGGKRYYSHNIPAPMTATAVINSAPIKVLPLPQSAQYTGMNPIADNSRYLIEGTVYDKDGTPDEIGVILSIVDPCPNVGEYVISVALSNGNYTCAALTEEELAQSKFTVTPKEIALSLLLAYSGKTYGNDDPIAWVGSDNKISGEALKNIFSAAALVNGDSVTDVVKSVYREEGENIGERPLHIELIDNCNYSVAGGINKYSFQITRKNITLRFVSSALTKIYDGVEVSGTIAPDIALTLSADSALASADAIIDNPLAAIGLVVNIVVAEGGAVRDSGTYSDAIVVNTIGVLNYNILWENGNISDYIIGKRPINIIINAAQAVYGLSSELTISEAASQPDNGGLVGGEDLEALNVTLSLLGQSDKKLPVGEYKIVATPAESNYSVSIMGGDVYYKVTPRPIIVNIGYFPTANTDAVYGDGDIVYGKDILTAYEVQSADIALYPEALAYNDHESDLRIQILCAKVSDESAIVTTSRPPVGVYRLIGSAASVNYDITFNKITLTVIKATPTIDISDITTNIVDGVPTVIAAYDGKGFTVRSGAFHDNTDLWPEEGFSYPAKIFVNVSDSGLYVISLVETDNFNATDITFRVVIGKATVIFDWSSVNVANMSYSNTDVGKVIDGVKSNFGTVHYSNNVIDEDAITNEFIDITVYVEATENYDYSSDTQRFYLIRATVGDFTFDDAEVVFDGYQHFLTITYAGEGDLPEGIESIEYSQNYLTHVGSLIVTASFTVKKGYAPIEDMAAELVVTARRVNIVIQGASKLYGEDDPENIYTWQLAETQTLADTAEVFAREPFEVSLSRTESEKAGSYDPKYTFRNALDYSVKVVSATPFVIKPRPLKVVVSGSFTSEYDGKVKSIAIDKYVNIVEEEGNSLAPWHTSLSTNNIISVNFAGGISIKDAGAYPGAITFYSGNDNYNVGFVNGDEIVSSITFDYIVTKRTITVRLQDQEVLDDGEIDHTAYDIIDGQLVKGESLYLLIRKGVADEDGNFVLNATSGNANYIVIVDGVAHLTYIERAHIEYTKPVDFTYTGNAFSIKASATLDAELRYYTGDRLIENAFVEPGHYEITIYAYIGNRVHDSVTVIFNINPIEITKDMDGTDITFKSDKGFLYEYELEIKHEQGRPADSEIADKLSGEFTIVDGYVFRIGKENDKIYIGEYFRETNATAPTVSIKVPDVYANDETVRCIVVRDGATEETEVAVKNGYITINAENLEAVAFIAERQVLMALVIIAAGIGIVGLLMMLYYIFRRKSY